MPARLLTESVGSVAPTPLLANTNRSNRPHIRWGLISAKRGNVGHGPSDLWRTTPSSTCTSNDSEKNNLALGGQSRQSTQRCTGASRDGASSCARR